MPGRSAWRRRGHVSAVDYNVRVQRIAQGVMLLLQRELKWDNAFHARGRRAWNFINIMLLAMAPLFPAAGRVAAT